MKGFDHAQPNGIHRGGQWVEDRSSWNSAVFPSQFVDSIVVKAQGKKIIA